jgi:hypothetical protein
MEELIIIDTEELRGLVAGFWRRLASKKAKHPSHKKRIKSAEINVERLKKEGKLDPNAKITIITEEESVIPGKEIDINFEKIMQDPSLIDAFINYLKREDHLETVLRKEAELIIDSIELTPEDKEKGKKALGGLFSLILGAILSVKTDLRADLRDGHIALINKAIIYARKNGIPPREVFDSDEHFKRFRRIRGVQGF